MPRAGRHLKTHLQKFDKPVRDRVRRMDLFKSHCGRYLPATILTKDLAKADCVNCISEVKATERDSNDGTGNITETMAGS